MADGVNFFCSGKAPSNQIQTSKPKAVRIFLEKAPRSYSMSGASSAGQQCQFDEMIGRKDLASHVFSVNGSPGNEEWTLQKRRQPLLLFYTLRSPPPVFFTLFSSPFSLLFTSVFFTRLFLPLLYFLHITFALHLTLFFFPIPPFSSPSLLSHPTFVFHPSLLCFMGLSTFLGSFY